VELLEAGEPGPGRAYAEDATFARFDSGGHGRDEIRQLFDD